MGASHLPGATAAWVEEDDSAHLLGGEMIAVDMDLALAGRVPAVALAPQRD